MEVSLEFGNTSYNCLLTCLPTKIFFSIVFRAPAVTHFPTGIEFPNIFAMPSNVPPKYSLIIGSTVSRNESVFAAILLYCSAP